MRFFRLFAPLILAFLGAAGCASSSSPFRLSGKVNFNGKPVPAGKIFFLPDSTKGGAGPGGFAEIKDGAYDTGKNGAGTMGGALIVRINGFDGKSTPAEPVGQPLFMNYEIKVDILRENPAKDFDVPAEAAKNLPGKAGEPP